MISKARARLGVLLWGILLLTFAQLMTDFMEAIYAFGLLGTSLPVEMVSLLLMFSPLVLLFVPRGLPGWAVLLLGQGALLCRALEPALDTRGRMLVSGLGVACFTAFLPALLHGEARERPRGGEFPSAPGLGWVGAMALAVVLSMLLRALGSGVDLSTDVFPVVGWIGVALASALAFVLFRPGRAPDIHAPSASGSPLGRGQERLGGDSRGGAWRVAGLCLSLSGVLALSWSTLAVPNVLARWTGASYLPVLAVAALAFGGFARLTSAKRLWASLLSPRTILAWNALFVLAIVGTVLAHQVRFPPNPALYPLSEPAARWWHNVPLWAMLLCSPVLALDFGLYLEGVVAERPTARALGVGFLVFSLFYLLVALGQIFTTVYDYVPVVGPFFRDRLWLVYLVAGVGGTAPVLLVRGPTFGRSRGAQGTELFPGAVLLIGALAIAGAAATASRPGVPAPKETLRVCTYNIQQGYDESGGKNYDGQLALLRRLEADVIGLQESDTNRISGGNSDVVRYMADRLDMHSYYGPKTVPGTFGIALLSRYPIEQPRTFYMYSAGEQTATLEAQLHVGERTVHVYVTHLGNEGPIVQQQAILQEVAGQGTVILMGDFNYRPDTPQYRLTQETLDDAWLLRWPDGVDDRGRSFPRRIDHIFVSPSTAVVDAQYITDPESDHPALVVEVVP